MHIFTLKYTKFLKFTAFSAKICTCYLLTIIINYFLCYLFQASKLGLLVSCRPNWLHHDNSIPILKSHSQMFCEHILGDRLFFQPYVLTLHFLGLWNHTCQSTPIIIWKQNTSWIMESSQSLLSKGQIRVLTEVYAIFKKNIPLFPHLDKRGQR